MSTIDYIRQSLLNISETVRDRSLVPKEHQQEINYGESNGLVTYDVTWPLKVKLVTPIHLRVQYRENSCWYYLATIANY